MLGDNDPTKRLTKVMQTAFEGMLTSVRYQS